MNYLHHPNCQGHQENIFGCTVPEEANPGSQPDSPEEKKCVACRLETLKYSGFKKNLTDEQVGSLCDKHKPEVPKQEHSHVGEIPGIQNTIYCEECFRGVSPAKAIEDLHAENRKRMQEPSFIDRKIEEFRDLFIMRDGKFHSEEKGGAVEEFLRTTLEETTDLSKTVEIVGSAYTRGSADGKESGRLAESKEIEDLLQKKLEVANKDFEQYKDYRDGFGSFHRGILFATETILAAIRKRK